MTQDDFAHDDPRVRSELPTPGKLASALRGLEMFGSDPYLSMQATNVDVVDGFISQLEAQLLRQHWQEDGTPVMEATFLSAQSQMWIFAVYEALRTWRERANGALVLADNGGFPLKIAALREDLGYQHHGRLMYADQLERLQNEPLRLELIRGDLRRVHVPFRRMEMLRVALAKHQISGKGKAMAYAPGYGRINMWTGAIDFELSTGLIILGTISHRDIADELREMANHEPPSDDDLASFDAAMNPPGP